MSGRSNMWSVLRFPGSGSVLLRSAHTRPSLSVAREMPLDSLRPKMLKMTLKPFVHYERLDETTIDRF